MSKNLIQFQKGVSIGSFIEDYGSEEQCRLALFVLRWPTGFQCPSCGNGTYCELSRRKELQCHKCHHQTSLTAGTLFQSTKLPLTKWFLAIYLMTQSKNGISQLELSRQVGVSINTAALIYHKIAQTMLERDNDKPLSGDIEADDAYWGGVKRGKRGRGSLNKTPFVAAVEKQDGKPQRIKLSVVEGFTNKSIRHWASRSLEKGSHVRTDGLACFRMIAKAGCTHQALIVGNSRNPQKTAPFNWVNIILGNLKTALRGTFHKLHPDHLSRHLATFSYRFNRRFQLGDMTKRFAYIALRTPPFPRRLLTIAGQHG
tara:strand:- start:105 stop:1046 length:942 start_codon:yes stop_codon:yes gene_type:complete